MKVMWIGHGGLLFVSGKHKVLIDPYLSNSLRVVDRFFWRKTVIKSRLYALKPDVIAITSSQIDRNDPKSIRRLAHGPFWFLGKYNLFYRFSKYRPTILTSREAYDIDKKGINLRRLPFTAIEAGVEWSLGDMTIMAVPAVTSDLTAYGIIITDNTDGRKYYVASNTLYSQDLIDFLPKDIHASFLPIDGMFGSMNALDASRFAKSLSPKYAIPVQFGTLDRVKPKEFTYEGKVVPKIYKVIDFDEDGGVKVSNSGINIFYNEKKRRKKKAPKEKIKEEKEALTENAPPLLCEPKKAKGKTKKYIKPPKNKAPKSLQNVPPALKNVIAEGALALESEDVKESALALESEDATDNAPILVKAPSEAVDLPIKEDLLSTADLENEASDENTDHAAACEVKDERDTENSQENA